MVRAMSTVLVSAVFLVFLSGCGEKKQPVTSEQPSQTESPKEESEKPKEESEKPESEHPEHPK